MVQFAEAEGRERRVTRRLRRGLPDEYLILKTPVIKAVQVPEVASAIEEWQGTLDKVQVSDHVANLKNAE